ncbi:hypothetical protein DSO57_1025587 [Entomophthora muscae]|uniref:Uncharacterized protein n=1 Tax=Entomophthora muscae TaxID=34485 RepID=A0ACC2T2F3_9FUNG|nr:hypothetical protein DSO57_1025587 [Entomophthora muscae]
MRLNLVSVAVLTWNLCSIAADHDDTGDVYWTEPDETSTQYVTQERIIYSDDFDRPTRYRIRENPTYSYRDQPERYYIRDEPDRYYIRRKPDRYYVRNRRPSASANLYDVIYDTLGLPSPRYRPAPSTGSEWVINSLLAPFL